MMCVMSLFILSFAVLTVMWASNHIFLPWIGAGKSFSAKFEYEGDVMRGYEAVYYPS